MSVHLEVIVTTDPDPGPRHFRLASESYSSWLKGTSSTRTILGITAAFESYCFRFVFRLCCSLSSNEIRNTTEYDVCLDVEGLFGLEHFLISSCLQSF